MMKIFKDYNIDKHYYNNIRANVVILESIFSELGKTLGVNPLREIKNVIHITGSNGKGSTSAFLHSILEAHGYTVNRYYKPYLIRVNEEILIHGKEMDDERFCDLHERVAKTYLSIRDTDEFRKKIEEMKAVLPTRIGIHYNTMDYSQLRAVAAFLAFYENPADFNIVEVRVGGWKDITNVFTKEQTVATILTNMQYGIGSNDTSMWITNEKGEAEFSDRAVAYHKTMLGKAGVPMIVANQSKDALEEIRRVATEEVKTNTVEYGRDWFIEEETEDTFVFKGYGYKMKLNKSKTLFEKFQTYNTATAIATFLSVVKDKDKMDPKLIQRGIDNAGIIGRPQRIISGRYLDYFGSDGNVEVITGVIKLNKSGVDSLANIADDKYFNYFIYTSGDRAVMREENHKLYFFDFMKQKNIADNSKLILYRRDRVIADYLAKRFKRENIPFVMKNNLSSSLEFVRRDVEKNKKIHKRNRVLIFCDSMNYFDRNIVFLNS
jgi:folylpolyglutamate synthase/dihydrofolate synthase